MKKILMIVIMLMTALTLASCGVEGRFKVKDMKKIEYSENGIVITWDNVQLQGWD